MNNLIFSTAISGMYDALLKGVAMTGRDAACHVSTTSRKRLRVALWGLRSANITLTTGGMW